MNKKKFEVALETLKASFAHVATETRVLRISHNFEKGNPDRAIFLAIRVDDWENGYNEIGNFVDFADFYFKDMRESYQKNAISRFMEGLRNIDEESNNISDLFVEFYENLKPDELIKSADKGIFEFLLVSGMKEIARISVNDGEPASSLLLIICVLFNLCVSVESMSSDD